MQKRLANHAKRTYKESSMREVAFTITSGAKKQLPKRTCKESSMPEVAFTITSGAKKFNSLLQGVFYA